MLNYFRDEELGEMDPIEAEVDAIRRQLWEETKNMTRQERWDYMRKQNEDFYKDFNIKVVSLPVKYRRNPSGNEG